MPRAQALRFAHSPLGRGVHADYEQLDVIPADTKIRPLRDQMVVKLINVMHSRRLIIPPHTSVLIRGEVMAIGPGHYPHQYLYGDPDKRKSGDNPERRKKVAVKAGTVFRPTQCKVGQIVHLDGRKTGKDAFDAFYYGKAYCIHCREEDVALVEND